VKEGHRWAPRTAMGLALLLQVLGIGLLFFTSRQLPVSVLVAVESFLVHILFAATPVSKIWQARARRQVRNWRSLRVTLLAGILSILLAVASVILPVLRQTDYFFLVSKSHSL
jgi:uncharacterized membrane protein YbaN (DUF454 family)